MSDISSSESDSELPTEGKAGEPKEEELHVPLMPDQQEERQEEEVGEREGEEEREEEEEVEKDSVCLKRVKKGDGEERISLVKEEVTVKITYDEEQGHTTLG